MYYFKNTYNNYYIFRYFCIILRRSITSELPQDDTNVSNLERVGVIII